MSRQKYRLVFINKRIGYQMVMLVFKYYSFECLSTQLIREIGLKLEISYLSVFFLFFFRILA